MVSLYKSLGSSQQKRLRVHGQLRRATDVSSSEKTPSGKTELDSVAMIHRVCVNGSWWSSDIR